MRFAFAIACVALLLPATLAAQAPPINQMSIYADEYRTMWCASGTPPYLIDMWIYLEVGVNGAESYGFDLEVPSNVNTLWWDLHTGGGPSECLPGYCPNGITGSFGLCLDPARFPVTWVMHASLEVTDTAPSVVRIMENPDYGTVRVTNCAGVHESLVPLTQLYVNYPTSAPECGTVPVEATTWGAVKALYR